MGQVERTRNADPITSAEAAASILLRHSQGEVLALFTLEARPLTDGELVEAAARWGSTYTGQRLRSARKELTRMNLIREVPGEFRPGPTGKRRAHVHTLAAAA